MNKKNAAGDYYEIIYRGFINYLVVTFFLEKDEEPPQEPDLLKFIYNNSREREFIDYLILNIHELVFIENFCDNMQTAISIHLQNIMDRKV